MNVSIALITLVILLFLLVFQIKTWKIRVLLSPGFYFALMWSLGVLGLLLFKSVDMLIEVYPEYIDELNVLVAYTGFCFFLLTRKGISVIEKERPVKFDFINSFTLFGVLSFLILGVAIVIFIKEGNGLNFGLARESMHETIANRNVLVNYLRLISTPLSLYAGYNVILALMNKKRTSLFKYVVFLFPYFANMLFSLTEGGRVSMVYSMLEYVIGASLAIPLNFEIRKYKKIFVVGILVAVFINGMITWVDNERHKYHLGQDADYERVQSQLGAFSFLYGASNYMYASYVGYQYRRVDAVTPELGYGQYVFNGFINWQFPFVAQFGLKDTSLAHLLDIYYHNQETYDFSREYYYTTHSAYIPIIKDFGFYGSFIAIFFLVYVAHSLFVKIQRYHRVTKSLSFFFYYLFFIYWVKSNFYGTLSNSILISFYGFFIVDILNSLFNKKTKKHSYFN